MTTARDIMTPGVECVQEHETLTDAAQKMRDLDVGSLPICGDDNRLKGMLTDRDIVTKGIAKGLDPASTPAGSLADGEVVTIGADDSVEDALQVMKEYEVRRLPVIDGHDMVGMISLQDIARNLSDNRVGDVVDAITT